MISILYRVLYYVSLPIDQHLKFKNRCSLLSIACLFIHISSAISSRNSSHHSSHASLYSVPIHSLFLSTLLMHLLLSFFSCTSPLHAYSFTFPQHAPHAPPLIILLMHLSIACLFIHISSACSSCTSSHHSSHASLHSIIHSHFLSTLLMHLISVFLSCTSL